MSERRGAVVARLTARCTIRTGATWGVVFGVYVATQAYAYSTSYPTIASRRMLAKEFGSNAGISALVGPARAIDTVAGYTVWKCLTVLAIAGAIWGLLAATKLLRGEEDAGRWELLLAGATTRRRATVEAIAGLGAGLGAMCAATFAILVVAGRSPHVGFTAGSIAYLALAIVAPAATFLAVGALTSQLCGNRRQAATYAAAALAASYAIRMVADSGTGLGWLRWLTPLGWVEELGPLEDPRPLALVPLAALVVVLCTCAVAIAGRRDLGASSIPDRASTGPHFGLLGGPTTLAIRLQRTVLIGWAVGITAYGLLLGSIARSGGSAITSSPSLRRAFARLGITGPEAYVGIALLIVAVLLAIVGVGQVGAVRADESEGHLEHLLVGTVSRRSWLGARIALAGLVVLVGALLAGIATWVGASLAHAGVGLPTLLDAAINTVPPALSIVGLGVVTFAMRPRWTTVVAYGFVSWSVSIELLGSIAHVNHWVLDTSPLHQMAPAPSAPISWVADAVMLAIAGALTALAVAWFGQRDLTGE